MKRRIAVLTLVAGLSLLPTVTNADGIAVATLSGGGSVVHTASITYGLNVACDATRASLQINWRDEAVNYSFQLEFVYWVACLNDPMFESGPPIPWLNALVLQGSGRLNGQGAEVWFVAIDGGEPGRLDFVSFEIVAAGGLTLQAEGGLEKGNNQFHF